jgi:hypothetical protein
MVNSALLFLVAALAIASALVARNRTRRSWTVIAAAAAYLSFDEAARLHERLARPRLATVPRSGGSGKCLLGS